mmetsp:Transcript_32065/g.85884  ORF Transcript_32065/g.85884 Transcript_32065/m.85884 type:complete len:311 (+) Transcript_32065:381-1313(+)
MAFESSLVARRRLVLDGDSAFLSRASTGGNLPRVPRNFAPPSAMGLRGSGALALRSSGPVFALCRGRRAGPVVCALCLTTRGSGLSPPPLGELSPVAARGRGEARRVSSGASSPVGRSLDPGDRALGFRIGEGKSTALLGLDSSSLPLRPTSTSTTFNLRRSTPLSSGSPFGLAAVFGAGRRPSLAQGDTDPDLPASPSVSAAFGARGSMSSPRTFMLRLSVVPAVAIAASGPAKRAPLRSFCRRGDDAGLCPVVETDPEAGVRDGPPVAACPPGRLSSTRGRGLGARRSRSRTSMLEPGDSAPRGRGLG